MTYFKSLLIMYLFCLPTAALAKLNSADAAAAVTTYNEALNKLNAGRKRLTEGDVIAFLEGYESRNSRKQSLARTLRLGSNGEEIINSINDTDFEDNGELNWQSNVLVDPNSFPLSAELVRETETNWVFRIPTLINAKTDNQQQEFDDDKINRKLSSALISELTISKQSAQLLTLKIYALTPFKPEPLAEISEFNVRIEFAQAWPNGPLVTKSISRVVKGKYAFFINVDEFSSKTFQNFRLIKDL